MSYPADPNKHCPSTCAECCAGASPPVSASCCAGTYSSQQCGPGGCGPGSVLLSCGAFSFNLDLLSISAVGGLGWSFSLNYLAGNGVNGIVGSGFNYDQNLQLQLIEDTTVRLVTPSNCNEDFYDAGDGLFLPESDNNTRASIVVTHSGASDEVYTLYAANGTITVFFGFAAGIACPGSVQSITDRHGNSQTFAWRITGGLAQVTSVVDSYGRSVGYAYFGAEQGYRLQQITDFLGRQLNFQYDSLGHLAAVVTPSIERAAPGNAFPGGTAYVFQYDVENPRADRQDDLIRIWFPNQTAPMLDAASRVVDVAAVYASGAIPRYAVVHGQDPTDANSYGLVTQEIIGNPRGGVGGVYSYEYAVLDDETNPIDGSSLVFSATMSDRNGNQTVYKFNAVGMPACVTVMANREKIGIPTSSAGESYVTWTSYNANNQPLVIVYPAGNSTQYVYEDGVIAGLPTSPFPPRVGLLLGKTELPGNSIGVPSRAGSSGQTELSERYFHDPIFGQMAARIEARGNPIDSSGDFFTPQNGGTAPSDADCSRYASIHWFDYQKDDDATISADATLQQMLGLSADQIITLMDFVNSQMTATDGSGGLPNGFARNLGDINGDGTGTGGSSGLPAATHAGNVVMSQDPSVTLVAAGDPSSWTPTQLRQRLFTTNARGQTTTMTDAEGNLTVYVRYPLADPDGAGQYIDPALGAKQYGQLKETHVDADPNDVLSLVGADGDLLDFIPNIITRTNASGVYQDLVTRYEGSAAGCAACAYDALGNPLAVTDPRGGATRYDRNERGEVFRVTSPAPYVFQVETYYDANRNVVRVDTQDQQVAFDSSDPASACFGHFTPSGSGAVANVPMRPGAGGAIRPGWFSNLYTFDLLDNKIQDDIDATGSTPASLVTTYLYDPNQNLIQITKPNGNLVEYDYDERNLRIAQRIGRDDATDFAGAVTVTAFDANGNLLQIIGPAQRGASGNWQTAMIQDAFRSGATLTHTGDSVLVNVYDGFDRVFTATDSVGGLTTNTHDPGNRLIAQTFAGTIGGATPSDTSGSSNETLTSSKTYFDEAGRPYEAQRDVFMATGTTVPSGRSIVHIGGGLAQNSTANDHTASATISTTPGPGNASYVLTRTLYDRSGRTVGLIQDLQPSTSTTAQATYAHDGANRRVSETDALGNSIAHEYDPAGNAVLTTRTELSTITEPTTATEIFESAAFYDCLGRMIMTAQQGPDGNLDISLVPCPATSMWSVPGSALVSLAGFDSRGNQVLTVDPKGNTAVMVFDGASRNLQSIQHLRSGGLGQNGPAPGTSLLPFTPGTITTTRSLDGNGNLLQLIDDRNDLTSFQYDTMDRETEMTFHDGSTRTRVYDEASDVVTYTDENGSVFTNTFDPLGRKVSVSIAAASGIGGTTAQSFQFDGLSRMTFARDSVSGTNADVTFVFDSLSRTLEESQAYGGNTRNLTNSYFRSYPTIEFFWPNSNAAFTSYDELYRRSEEIGGDPYSTTNWQYFGPNRVAEMIIDDDLIWTYLNNARTNSAVQSTVPNPAWGNQSSDRLGYDGSGRPITKRFLSGGINDTTHAYNDTTALVGFTTAYDRASNKLYERSLHCDERDHLYQAFDPTSNAPLAGCYDSLDRLLQYQRGVLSTTGGPGNAGGGSISTAIALPNADSQRTYTLDGLGNWRRDTYMPVGGSLTNEVRQHNGLNEITRVSTVGGDSVNFSYDGATGASNGNLANDGQRIMQWDALNRLLEVKRVSDSAVIQQSVYDALNRRIRKTISNGGLSSSIPNGTTDYLYSGWQCLEERNPFGGEGSTDTPTKQYLWGHYLDECLWVSLLVEENDLPAGTYYPLQDHLYRTIALVDYSGVIREAYDYDAYGNTLVFRNSGSPPAAIAWSDSDTQVAYSTCEFLFTGQRYDAEIIAYYYKRREYIPQWGRFTSRDPIVEGSPGLYVFCDDSPLGHTDPLGLATVCCTQWTRRSTVLGYAYNKKGGIKCLLVKFGSMGPLNQKIAAILISLGVTSIAQIAAALKSPILARRLGHAGFLFTILQTLKLMNDFGTAGEYCRAEVCTQTVPKVAMVYNRSWYNPCRWWSGPAYLVLECPKGTDEVELNEGNQATREPDPIVPLPN